MNNPLHEAFAAIDQNSTNELHIATAKGLMTGYHTRWKDAGWETIETEQEFMLPVVNPNSGRISRTFNYAGKFDGTVTDGAKRLLLEHKTTSDSIEDPTAPYWMRLDIDAQIDLYSLANLQMGEPVDGVLYDVIRKPGIRPKKSSGETIPQYQVRLGEDTIARPDFYFGRKVIYRLDEQLLEAAEETWNVATEIREARAKDRHYRNSNACLAWGRPCEYLPICSGRASPEDDRYTNRKAIHPELPVLSNSGANCKDVLTNSRLAVFRQCRRKHFYRFELGIERATEEDSEALAFGTLFHLALNAWHDCFKKEVTHA